MGEKGTGKTKQLIELINDAATHSSGCVVCIEAKSALTYDVSHQVRLISAGEYDVSSYESLRGFISGLYASNYDISHIFIDNLFKIVGGICNQEADNFLNWLNRFSGNRNLKITVSVSGNPQLATDGMQQYL